MGSEKPDWHEHGDAVAGALLCLGGMLFEWGLPLDKAIKGLCQAYAIEEAKRLRPPPDDFLAGHPDDRSGCFE